MKEKVRNSNLELYRIIIMLLIVAHHYVRHSGLVDLISYNTLDPRSLYLYILGMWGKIGINCFVLITGYFMCKSHITLKKFTKLFLWILFYNFIISFLFETSGYSNLSLIDSIIILLPIKNISNEFTSCFLVFYLFIPFLNILIRNMNRKQHFHLILLCLFTYSLWGQLPYFEVRINYTIWFCILYFISSFIRIYQIDENSNSKTWGIVTLITIMLSIFSVYAIIHYGKKDLATIYYFVSDSNALLAIAVSISSFIFFKKIKINHNKLINNIGASTFGVLLIHDNNIIMRKWLWKDMLNITGHYHDNIYIHSIIWIFAIFFICIIIDYIRLYLFEKPLFQFLDNYLKKYKNEFFIKYWN